MANALIFAVYLIVGPVCVRVAAQNQEYPYNFSGAHATASSYYNFSPNKKLDKQFLPYRAIDGVEKSTSWWSGGGEVSKVYWQSKMTSPPPKLTRMVIRWHGFLTPSNYRIRVSYAGDNFQTIAVVTNKSIEYDRIDALTSEFASIPSSYYYLRIVMDIPNTCMDASTCTGPSILPYKSAMGDRASTERIIYGIREIELWLAHPMTSRARFSRSIPPTELIVLVICILLLVYI
ncbi:unnamed protein product [Albugo candida]|uniref:F5/8 type C domain-containing protein n=1 Tax=Albugo candida TaxID=65357 RepID=A0A024GEE4_9STRA|nr:unnamed protein product [Albugo candida]|eukprot:CCI45049.1 unnamed protein product [Albugo candida]